MVLLVLGVPIVVLLLALALARLEAVLLPPRDPETAGAGRGGPRAVDLADPAVTRPG
jgi:hypothetical protein